MKYTITTHKVNDLQLKMINLVNDLGLKVSLLDYGASIYSIYLHEKLLTVSAKEVAYHTFPGASFGKTVGRIAGRIKGAQLEVDGITYQLEKSRLTNDTLHSGSSNFANKIFNYEIKEDKDEIKVIFNYLSLEKEAIIPGDINVRVIYTLYRLSNKIRIDFNATSTKNTYLNITNHTFYNLSGNFVDGIENHYLMINAKQKAISDEALNPIYVENCRKEFDFSTEKLLKDNLFTREVLFRPHRGYDDAFLLDKPSNNLALSLYSPYSNIRLNVYTSYPGVVIYTGGYPAFMELCEEVKNKFQFDSLCIEPQYIPNGYNILDKKYMYLDKNKEYNHYIELEFSKELI